MSLLEQRYKEAFAEEQEISILHPQMMTREDYLKIMSSGKINRHMEKLASDVKDFVFDSQFLICGFDKDSAACILLLEAPGRAIDCTNTVFAVVGSGAEKATSSLLFDEVARAHGVAQTLYDCFDAKVRSELAPGVGYDWEMRSITCAGAVSLHTNPKALLESVWSKFNRSPFEKREEDDPPEPPDDWETQLRTLVATSLQGCEPDQIRSIDEIAEGGA
jgi:hypothetical protein